MEIKLKAYRVNRGLSIYEMAHLLNVSKSTVSRWEREEGKISREKFEQYCTICKIDDEAKEYLRKNYSK